MGIFRRSNPVADLLKRDEWTLVQVEVDSGFATIRYRTPVLAGQAQHGYDRLLMVVWPYAPEGTGALPTDEQNAPMTVFEDRFCEAVESDALAVLTAVLTFDGAR